MEQLLVTTFEPQEQALGMAPSNPVRGKRKAEEMEEDGASAGGWIYIGSHNFSPAAWVRPQYILPRTELTDTGPIEPEKEASNATCAYSCLYWESVVPP
jgi:hypothetical protein